MSTGCALDGHHLAGQPYSPIQASVNPWHGQPWRSYRILFQVQYCWHGHLLRHRQS